MNYHKFGFIAHTFMGVSLTNKVLKSGAGYYIGTEQDGAPFSRESEEYYAEHDTAKQNLSDHTWTQRVEP